MSARTTMTELWLNAVAAAGVLASVGFVAWLVMVFR